MWKVNNRNYISLSSLSRATNMAMGNGAFASVSMTMESFNVIRKSLDGVCGNLFLTTGLALHLLVLVGILLVVSRQEMS